MPRAVKTAPNIFEGLLYKSGFSPVIGVDEAGRGPLVGPVVACALILPKELVIEGVTDSKKLSPLKRGQLAAEIKTAAIAYAFGIVHAAEIDRINILQATMLAMGQAIDGVLNETKQAVALIDGTTAPLCGCPTISIVKGDFFSHLIGAASILAKVERDTMMETMHKQYPEYGFDQHKGYGTVAHKHAIEKYGLCPEHRRSFCRKVNHQL
ncbi:MAG: ribonuclease HII [Defluviitaleaceae bacterium]|nr:ribonuclease HII [Defluviitaleaceae bacterium]